MKAVRIPITIGLLLQLLGVPSGGIELADAYLEHGTAEVFNIVLSGDQFPELQECEPYPVATVEIQPQKAALKF